MSHSPPPQAPLGTTEMLEQLLLDARRAAASSSSAATQRARSIEKDEAVSRARVFDAQTKSLTSERDNALRAFREAEARAAALDATLQDTRTQLAMEMERTAELTEENSLILQELSQLRSRGEGPQLSSEVQPQREAGNNNANAVSVHLEKLVATFEAHVLGLDAARLRVRRPTVAEESVWEAELASLQHDLVDAQRTVTLYKARIATLETLTRQQDCRIRELEDALGQTRHHHPVTGSCDECSVAERACHEAELAKQRYTDAIVENAFLHDKLLAEVDANERLRVHLADARAAIDVRRGMSHESAAVSVEAFADARREYEAAVETARRAATTAEMALVDLRAAHDQALRDLHQSEREVVSLRSDIEQLREDRAAAVASADSRAALAESRLQVVERELQQASERLWVMDQQQDNLVYVAEKSSLLLTEAQLARWVSLARALELESMFLKAHLFLRWMLPESQRMVAEMAVSTTAGADGEVLGFTNWLAAYILGSHAAGERDRAHLDAALKELRQWQDLFPVPDCPTGPEGAEQRFQRAAQLVENNEERGLFAAHEAEARQKLIIALQASDAELKEAREQLAAVAPRQGEFFEQQRGLLLRHLVRTIRTLKQPKFLLDAAFRQSPSSVLHIVVPEAKQTVGEAVADIAALRRSADRLIMSCFTTHERSVFALANENAEDLDEVTPPTVRSLGRRAVTPVNTSTPVSSVAHLYSRTATLDQA